MYRHGSSHGLALFLCTVASSILVHYLKPLFPPITKFLESVAGMLVDKAKIPLPKDTMVVIMVATVLAFIWGIFFKMKISD